MRSMIKVFVYSVAALLACNLCAKEYQITRDFHKVVFIGNSITKHGPSKKVDWSGNWGMAASEAKKDYVHIVTAALTKKDKTPPATLVKNAAAFERGYMTFDMEKEMKDIFEFNSDLVIVALGENVRAFKDDAQKATFKKSLKDVLLKIKEKSNPLIVIRSCFWAHKVKDPLLKEIAQEIGGRFVDMSNLCKDKSNFARSERDYSHKGVAGHPGDKGMQAIADGIISCIATQ